MTIEFRCPSCNKLLRTSDDRAGARAKCPDCGTGITVPRAGGTPAGGDFDLGEFDEEDARDAERYGTAFAPEPRLPHGRPGSADDTKNCPMCGAEIKAAAVKCRFCGEMLEARPGLPGADRVAGRQFAFAGFWMRFGAWFIDQLILSVVTAVLCLAVGIPIIDPDAFDAFDGRRRGRGGPPNQQALRMLVNIIMLVISWLYHALMEVSANQGSLGKMALGIKVTDEVGDPISFGRATGRFFGKIISGCICLVGYFMAGFTEKKQALHDMMAGCLVIRK